MIYSNRKLKQPKWNHPFSTLARYFRSKILFQWQQQQRRRLPLTNWINSSLHKGGFSQSARERSKEKLSEKQGLQEPGQSENTTLANHLNWVDKHFLLLISILELCDDYVNKEEPGCLYMRMFWQQRLHRCGRCDTWMVVIAPITPPHWQSVNYRHKVLWWRVNTYTPIKPP